MKTWEVIKELMQKPNKVYQQVDKENNRLIVQSGEIQWDKGGGRVVLDRWFLNREWEEAKQPVPWQEALEAWANGAAVKCEINDGSGFTLFYKGNLYPEDGDEIALCSEEILKGTWYILGEEAKTNE